VRFLVDAQLPRRLVILFSERGHDARHTLDLPEGNATVDRVVAAFADREERVLVTKDSDFRNTRLLENTPQRLLYVTTGNISNAALLRLIDHHLVDIERAFETASFAELSSDWLIVHG
jgi:predicted nuclease of predicted toxin-antitoxin system